MYKIFADNTLIYDSTLEDYKIQKATITLETNKSGSFSFAIYPDHFFYDNFVRLKTVIVVYKSDRIVFRGRILNDMVDYWNNKVITCEGELGFLQDSIIRPYANYVGTPESFFTDILNEHNKQVDEFKQFKIGKVTVTDPNNRIARSNSDYATSLENLNSRLIEDSLGGYFYITHGENGNDPIPTLNYLADFTNVSTQMIEFGSNLKDYTKTTKADDLGTALIPLGASTDEVKLTIAGINNGKDYIYSEEGVALYGWIFKTASWDDVTDVYTLKAKGEEYLNSLVKQNITIELTAIDLHLLDRSIESFKIGDYIRVVSEPHNFDSTLLCNKQTLDLLNPANDSLTLGYTYLSFTGLMNKSNSAMSAVKKIQSSIANLNNTVNSQSSSIIDLENSIANLPGNGTNYVPDEQKTESTWIDGKPIYSKILTLTGAVSGTIHSIPVDVENIDSVWIDAASSFCVHSNGYYYPVSLVDIGATFCFVAAYYKPDNVVQCYTGANGIANFYVRLFYTKTTDIIE